MDPVTALGVAGNVITLVELGAKIFSTSREVFQKGQVEEYFDLELVVKNIRNISQDLEASLQSTESSAKSAQSEHEVILRRLAERIQEICQEISQVLTKIHIKGRQNKWSSLRAAIRTIWNEDRINALRKRLDEIRQELIVSVLLSFRWVDDYLGSPSEGFKCAKPEQ